MSNIYSFCSGQHTPGPFIQMGPELTQLLPNSSNKCHTTIIDALFLSVCKCYLLTPTKQNLVMEHNHEKAVADGVNVGCDIYRINTQITQAGSKNFFEQMKGRGVRVVSDTEMEQVNPGIKRKTRYVIVDAVGVCERVQTESRPLEKKPTVSFEKLLDAAALGTTEVAAIESLAGRLIRLERRFDAEVGAEVVPRAA